MANNEALYLEREAPPTDTKEKRVLLIDSTIKNWGTPKTIGFAIAVALAHHPKNKIDYKAYILGDGFTDVDLNNKDSIIENLQLLSGQLHPASTLEFFLQEHEQFKDELIFITEKSNLKKAKLLEVLHNYREDINFIIETDNEGIIDVFKKNRSGKKHLQRISLPVEQLWQQKKPKSKKRDKQPYEPIDHYPILFDTPGNTTTLSTEDGFIYIITRDKKLFRKASCYRTNEKGWELIQEHLPISYGQFEIGINPKGEHTLLLFDSQHKIVHLLNIVTKAQTDFLFAHWDEYKPDFIFHEGAFRHNGWSIDTDWKMTSSEPLPIAYIEKRKAQLEQAHNKYHIVRNVLRNIKSVKISSDRRLIFNKHALLLKSGQHFKLDVSSATNFIAEAEHIEQGVFQFEDGSTVQVNRSGMLVLISSDANIEPIYIPSALDCALGISTPSIVSGKDFYHRKPLVKLILKQTNVDKAKLAMALSSYSNLDLNELTALIVQTPCDLNITTYRASAEDLVNRLRQNIGGGIDIEFVPFEAAQLDQRVIDPMFFYEKYLSKFINQILIHGTQT